MDQRRGAHGKQPKRGAGRTVRQLWLGAAGTLVVTYAALLWRASLSTDVPTQQAVERAALFDAARTSMPQPVAPTLASNTNPGDGLSDGLASVVNAGASKGLLRVEADAVEAKTEPATDAEPVAPVETDAPLAAHKFTNMDALPVKQDEADELEEDVPLSAHMFTDTDALPVKADATDAPVYDDASLAAHEFTGVDALPVATEEPMDAHLFTDASYFDGLLTGSRKETAAKGTPQTTPQFTDASNFNNLAAVEPTEQAETQALYQVPDASFGRDLDGVSVEEQEELPPVKTARFDDSRLVQYVEPLNETVPMVQRHSFISGYDATIEYLANYHVPEGSNEQLFLFFVCSDANGTAFDWKPVCADAKKVVYDIFSKSPSTNRLVTIYAGPEEAWKGPNMLNEDDDLRLKSVPSIMRWDGGAPGAKPASYGMMIDESVLSEPFLRYLFRNTDQVDERLAQPDVKTKEIVTVTGYKQYSQFVASYKENGESYPLFMILMSGRWKSNNRLWCQFSRQSELPLEYAFYAFAPRDARFLIVETYELYTQWKGPDNEFKKDPALHPKGVPWFFRVYPEAGGELLFQRVKQRLHMLDSLRLVFEDSA